MKLSLALCLALVATSFAHPVRRALRQAPDGKMPELANGAALVAASDGKQCAGCMRLRLNCFGSAAGGVALA